VFIGGVAHYVTAGGNATFPSDPLDDDEDNNGFQLLNEVETGGTLSSLFTILRLFTWVYHHFSTTLSDN
jgi:lysophospholipid hydrolase